MERLGQTRLGFLNSQIARSEGWQAQLSAPMSTQGSILGQIDVFSCDPERRFNDSGSERIDGSGQNARRQPGKGAPPRAAGPPAGRRSRDGASHAARAKWRQAILSCARDLTGAVSTRLSLNGENVHTLDESGLFAPEAAAQAGSVIFLRRKLISSRGLEVGWIEVAKPMPGSFSREDEIALTDLAAQAADALDAAQGTRGARPCARGPPEAVGR